MSIQYDTLKTAGKHDHLLQTRQMVISQYTRNERIFSCYHQHGNNQSTQNGVQLQNWTQFNKNCF